MHAYQFRVAGASAVFAVGQGVGGVFHAAGVTFKGDNLGSLEQEEMSGSCQRSAHNRISLLLLRVNAEHTAPGCYRWACDKVSHHTPRYPITCPSGYAWCRPGEPDPDLCLDCLSTMADDYAIAHAE